MADMAKILQLVEQGVLSPEEADHILAALAGDEPARAGRRGTAPSTSEAVPAPEPGNARHLRVQITDHGRQVVNLRVPINIAGFAADLVPGLPDAEADRIRQAIRSGLRGPIVDIGSDDGERVLIVSE